MAVANFARNLISIAELLKNQGTVGSVESPRMSKDLAELVDKLRPILFVEMEISQAELLTVAYMFAAVPAEKAHRSGECLTKHVLASVFGYEDALRNQIELLISMDKEGILDLDHKVYSYEHATRELRIEPRLALAYAGGLKITDYTYANIIRDEKLMYRNRVEGFRSNLEFLESWAPIVDSIDWDRHDGPLADAFNFEISISTVDEVHRMYDCIQKRLDATDVEIPFRKLVSEFVLTREEQIFIMYDVYYWQRRQREVESERRAFDIPSRGVFAAKDTPMFMGRPLLARQSKLVECQVFNIGPATLMDAKSILFESRASL